MNVKTVIAAGCLGVLAAAAVPGAGFAQTSKQPTATAPSTGAAIFGNGGDGGGGAGKVSVQDLSKTAPHGTSGSPTANPNDAAISTTRSNIRHPNVVAQPNGGSAGSSPKPNADANSAMQDVSTTR